MAFGNKTSFTFETKLDAKTLFAPLQGSFVLELADENDFDGITLGTTNDNGVLSVGGTSRSLNEPDIESLPPIDGV